MNRALPFARAQNYPIYSIRISYRYFLQVDLQKHKKNLFFCLFYPKKNYFCSDFVIGIIQIIKRNNKNLN
jgi:hypothetical protein